MNKLLVVGLPKAHGEVVGWWYNGLPVYQGNTKESLNYAMLYAHENHIVVDQARHTIDHENFLQTLRLAGFELEILPFPEELNQPNNLYHDAVFIRDSGIMTKDYWIKSHYSAMARQSEAETHAATIAKKYNKEILTLPATAFLEGGEIHYFETKSGSYYFGGLSRANKLGHEFARSHIKPDNFYLIKSQGYHLDTIFSPVISHDNKLIAIVVAKDMVDARSLDLLKKIGIEMIYVNAMDSSGEGDKLGSYAANTVTAPGIIINSAKFSTPGVEEKLSQLQIKRFVSPLTYFRYSGGSFHCLTNEIR